MPPPLRKRSRATCRLPRMSPQGSRGYPGARRGAARGRLWRCAGSRGTGPDVLTTTATGVGMPLTHRRILTYAAPPRNRGGWRRRPAAATLVVAFIAVGWITYPTVVATWARARLLYWQQKCLRHEIPDHRVVYENCDLTGQAHPQAAVVEARRPKCWRRLRRLLSPTLSDPGGTVLFLHTLHNTDGCERLVVVELLGVTRKAGKYDLSLRTRTVQPASPRAGLVDLGWQSASMSLDVLPEHTLPLRIHGGHVSACDPCSFVIPFELGGRRGVIDGSMCGDDVVLVPDWRRGTDRSGSRGAAAGRELSGRRAATGAAAARLPRSRTVAHGGARSPRS